MPKSMTGFARTDHSASWGNVVCELKSVNHRFLDLSFRMPDSLRSFEHQFREQIRRSLNRGKVECSISVKFNSGSRSGSETEVKLDKDLAKSYIKVASELSELTASDQPLDLLEIMLLPGVLGSQEIDEGALQSLAKAAVGESLLLLEQSRQREGDALGKEILDRTNQIRQLTAELTKVVPAIRASLEDKIRRRLSEVDSEINQDRLEQELIFLAQKMDVEEEIDRLNAHLNQINELVSGDQPIGRKLDFLMQELNREANTLASKSQGLTQTNTAVEMKVLIEQIREQIQNIE